MSGLNLLFKSGFILFHEEKVIEISKNARELGVNLFRPQVMACYSYCHAFHDVTFVCDSKRGKQMNCVDLRKMNWAMR